jgi:glycogen operon protein
VQDDDFYLIVNAHHEPLHFTLPRPHWGAVWVQEFDTDFGWADTETLFKSETGVRVEGRSLMVLRRFSWPGEAERRDEHGVAATPEQP